MKAAEFDYLRAGSIGEACEALAGADGGTERKIVAGGQTLAPLMAMRLARPSLLIDINDVAELHGVRVADDELAIKACTRQRRAELSGEVRARARLLARALAFVGHVQIRNRGTIGGSLAHGDPAAEIPLAARALDATLIARSSEGETVFAAGEFFVAPMATALRPNQCLTEIRFPVWPDARVGAAFHEVASRAGDFAIVAACAQLRLDADGRCARLAAAAGGVGPVPVRFTAVERALTGTRLGEGELDEALALTDPAIEPDDDLHASAAYRRRVCRVLLARAIRDAAAEARA